MKFYLVWDKTEQRYTSRIHKVWDRETRKYERVASDIPHVYSAKNHAMISQPKKNFNKLFEVREFETDDYVVIARGE